MPLAVCLESDFNIIQKHIYSIEIKALMNGVFISDTSSYFHSHCNELVLMLCVLMYLTSQDKIYGSLFALAKSSAWNFHRGIDKASFFFLITSSKLNTEQKLYFQACKLDFEKLFSPNSNL